MYSNTSCPKEFPKTLKEFGYGFNQKGQLRQLDDMGQPGDKPFEYDVSTNVEYNQKRYEALGEVITEYVYSLLETEGLKRVPITKDSGDAFVFATDDAFSNPDQLMLLIHGSGVVRAGQWARRLIINDCLDSGTQLPYIRHARRSGFGVLVMNTNQNWANEKRIRGSENAMAHAVTVWQNMVSNANAKRVAIVAHSFGGTVTVELASQFKQEFESRVFAIAFTDSAITSPDYIVKTSRNWLSSELPLDAPIPGDPGDVDQVSAGTKVHEMTSCSSMDSVFRFIEDRLLNQSKSEL